MADCNGALNLMNDLAVFGTNAVVRHDLQCYQHPNTSDVTDLTHAGRARTNNTKPVTSTLTFVIYDWLRSSSGGLVQKV
jgi:hypothetical protein